MPRADDLIGLLREIDESRWYTNFGPLAKRFEAQLAGRFQPRTPVSVVSVCNCTLALELLLAARRLPADSTVLVPALTFVATGTAIKRAGHRLLVADVDPQRWTLTPEIARTAAAAHRIACVIPVTTLGCPVDAEQWDAFSAETGIPVIIDAAGAFGNQAAGRNIAVAFSLHATKTMGMGEGGFAVSGNAEWIERVRCLSNFGIDPGDFKVHQAGTNAKLSEYHAAVGIAALARWPERATLRSTLAADYRRRLEAKCAGIRFQQRPGDGAYAAFCVLLPASADPALVGSRLSAAGIETRRWYYPPLNGHPAFADSLVAGSLQATADISGRMLGLPFHLDLNPIQIDRIAQELAQILNET
ncbi:MAG: DegT/DnrJ/EryC1/StrS family aminotransferase [Burkholderiales bacterium]|nr:DegT/DnrJ/EryC1/StrS family aminotransferase [Burkholderiales bacterium]